jgi:hypothetical protein
MPRIHTILIQASGDTALTQCRSEDVRLVVKSRTFTRPGSLHASPTVYTKDFCVATWDHTRGTDCPSRSNPSSCVIHIRFNSNRVDLHPLRSL